MSAQTQYGIYFSQNGRTVRLPVNPEEIIIECPADNTRYNVLGLGEIVVPRTPKLRQISWECFLPGTPEPYALTLGSFKKPEFYINLFDTYKNNREQVRFIVNRFMEDGGAIFDTNIKIVVEDFQYSEKAGETGDFYYSIKLSEYRNYTPQVVTLSATPSTTVKAVATPQRETASDIISVGDAVIANGKYWYTSWGEKPYGTANNRQTTVTRIVQNPVKGQNYPILIGALGWLQLSQLKKVAI